MRSQVEEHSAAGFGSFTPGPGTKLRTIAVKVRLIEHQPAQRAGPGQLSYGLKISVPAGIVKDGKQASALSCCPHQLLGLTQAGGERLINHDIASCKKAPPGKIEMRAVRRSDDYKPDFIDRQQLFQRRYHLRLGIERGRVSPVALQNGR